MKPEIILFKFLSKFDKKLEKQFKDNINEDIFNLGFRFIYIHKILKYLNINFLDIVHFKDGNKYKSILNINEYINVIKKKNDFIQNFDIKQFLYTKNKDKIIQEKINKIPDILLVFHEDLYIDIDYFKKIYNVIPNNKIITADNYGIDTSSLNNYPDIIEFNGYKYKLDSCSLRNYNADKLGGHAIVGITCENSRYVYNGWTLQSTDPVMIKNDYDNKNQKIPIPCSLIKFDWNLHKNDKFCLNSDCFINNKIDSNKKHCFSFNKADRVLIYVKINDRKTGSITSLSNYSIDYNDIKLMIKDIYNVDLLSDEHIAKIIKILNIKDYKDKNDILKALNEKYGIIQKEINKITIYNSYKHLKDYKGSLLKQQVFLSSFIIDNYRKIDRLLLFHGIGTGKTCTSITICETIMENHKEMKVLVLLPARLKTNFIDELISVNCGNFKYISQKDFELYTNNLTSVSIKNKIRKQFLLKIQENYNIMSYEGLRNIFLKSNDIKKTIHELTHNKIIIIDEVHNLITSKLDPLIIEKIIKANKIISKLGGINAIILRLLSLLADNSAKFFYLTATPIFDNYGQFIELILNLCPKIKYQNNDINLKDLPFLLNELKGKVSFYKLKDLSDLPVVKYDNILIPLSNTQAKFISNIRKDKKENEKSNSFCIIERQLSISVFNNNQIFK